MASSKGSSSNPGASDPYEILGLDPDSNFEEVQKARDKRLAEVGEDPLAKAKIEASYDTLLMSSLKERQLGKVSNAAVSASKREDRKIEAQGDMGTPLLTRLQGLGKSKPNESGQGFVPELSLPVGEGLTIRFLLGLLALVLLLVSPPESIQIILSLSTIGLFVSQIRRGRRSIPSLGWCILLLAFGLIFGELIVKITVDQSQLITLLSSEQIESIPAIFLIWLGALFLA